MILGHIIKNERVKQAMKQNYLAKGICSPSYLSKIENNYIEPSDEILNLIFGKLGIELNRAKEEANHVKIEKDNKQFLLGIYKEISINRNEIYARKVLEELVEQRFLFTDRDSFYLFYLVSIRILFIIKENITVVEEYLNPLLVDKDKLNKYEVFLLEELLGIFYFNSNDIQQSMNNFDEAIKISKHIILPSWEKADLYYMYSLVCLSSHQNVKAMEYSEMALEIFKENFQFKRLIESLIIQGISYKNSFDYELSLKSYEKAIEIIEKFQVYEFKALAFQNLGSLYLKLKEYNKALDYFLESLDLKKESDNRIVTIFSIVQIYSRFKQYEGMNSWIQKGLDEIATNNIYINYIFHFNIYRLMTEDNEEKFEIYLLKSIQFFEKNNDFRHLYKYCIKMAQMFQNKKKYKKATVYFEKAFTYLNTLKNNFNWEDI